MIYNFMSELVIKISNLSKSFKDTKAIDGISLSVNKGDVYGVLGANGAGKTTTISTVLGLIEADEGEVEVLGQRVSTGNNAILTNIGSLVGDGTAYFPYMTGRENMIYMANRFEVDHKRVDNILKFMGIYDARNRKPSLYSTGMKQRLGIAMAIIHDPEILILDEPTNGMDPAGMRDIRNLIKELANHGTTIVLCSHLLHEVEQVCNRVAIFNKGKIITEGNLENLKGNGNIVCLETDNSKETLEFLMRNHYVAEIDSQSPNLVYVNGIDSKPLIELLVNNSLTPNGVYTKENNLEELYLKLIQSQE